MEAELEDIVPALEVRSRRIRIGKLYSLAACVRSVAVYEICSSPFLVSPVSVEQRNVFVPHFFELVIKLFLSGRQNRAHA